MKKLHIITVSLFLLVFGSKNAVAQVGIMNNNPAPSAVLDLKTGVAGSEQKGLLIPQVSLTDISSGAPIVTGSPATSLLVYNTNTAVTGGSGTGYYYWDGIRWQRLVIGGAGIPDNLGNHTAAQTLNMASQDIKNANKTTTTTSAIAKGVDGKSAQQGSLLTAGDALGNANWMPPVFPRTFYWKGTSLLYDACLQLTTVPSSAPFTEFNGRSYTAPTDGTLDVSLLLYTSFYPALGFLNNANTFGYANVSVNLQPLENGIAIPGSATTAAASPVAQQVYPNGPPPTAGTIGVNLRESLYLCTRFRVKKGATYTFAITCNRDAAIPADAGISPMGFVTFSGFGASSATLVPNPAGYASISGVLYTDQ